MSKPSPILPHMPWNVKKLIVASADIMTKLSLRPCSTDFNELVARSQIAYENLLVDISLARTTIRLNIDADNSVGHVLRRDPFRRWCTIISDKKIINRDMLEVALEKTVKVFKNPKVVLQNLELFIDEDTQNFFLKGLQRFFVSQNRKVSVEHLHLKFDGTQDDILKVLPHLKPGTLKSIEFSTAKFTLFNFEPVPEIDLSRIAETEQWKKAENLIVKGYRFELPVEKWSHFKDVKVEIPHLTVTLIQDILQAFANSPCWKTTSIRYKHMDLEEVLQHFAEAELLLSPGQFTVRYSEHVTVTITGFVVTIEKTD